MAGWVSRMMRWFGRGRETVVQAYYELAKTTRRNQNLWSDTRTLSADAAASSFSRTLQRNRARVAVANNSVAMGMVETLALDVLGPNGPLLQLGGTIGYDAVDDSALDIVELEFMRWAASVNLPHKLRQMRKAVVCDGEAFAFFFENPKVANRVQLDVRLLDPDLVTDPLMTGVYRPLSRYNDGIHFDADGNAEAYDVLKHHPGDPQSLGREFVTIPAAVMLHYFKPSRVSQTRGVPEIGPAVHLLEEIRRWTGSTVAAAETAANFAALIYADISPDDGPDKQETAEQWNGQEIRPRTMATLPIGWKAEQMKAEQPTSTYHPTVRSMYAQAARCLNMPVNIVLADSSDSNFASGQLDHQTYDRSIATDRHDMRRAILDRVFAMWLRFARDIDGFLPASARREDFVPRVEWLWHGRKAQNPIDEANSQEVGLAIGSMTLAEIWGAKGVDWRAAVKQRAREVEATKSMGLTWHPIAEQKQPPANPSRKPKVKDVA